MFHVHAGDQAFFVCGGWLGSSSCGKQGASLPASCRLATALEPAELPASTVDPRKALKDYTVCVCVCVSAALLDCSW